MKRQTWLLGGIAVAALLAGAGTLARAAELDSNALLNADKDPNNWVMYHRTYNSYHYSPLDQINTSNVKDLKVAWMHNPGASPHGGIQSFPLAIDGGFTTRSPTIRYGRSMARPARRSGHSSRRSTRTLAEATPYNPFNRGLAAAYGKLYIGTVDGRLIAVDMQTGKRVWDTKLNDVAKGAKGFTGAPLVVKDKVIVGSNGGELAGCCGPIFGVDAQTGKKIWQFDTIGGDERSLGKLGRRQLEDRRRRRLDDRRLRPEHQHGVLGHGEPGAGL